MAFFPHPISTSIKPSSIEEDCFESTNELNKPSVGILFKNSSENREIRDLLESCGSITIKCDYSLEGVDLDALNSEIDSVLTSSFQIAKPIPQRIVQAANQKIEDSGSYRYPLLRELKEVSAEMLAKSNAILLPGGSSIHPKFYGETLSLEEDEGVYIKSIKRAVLEFFLIHGCRELGIPLLGICRGHQSLNIFFGSSLDRSSVGEFQEARVRKIEISPFSRVKNRFLTEIPSHAYFNHHQVVLNHGKELTASVTVPFEENFSKELAVIDEQINAIKLALCIGEAEQDPFGQLPLIKEEQLKMQTKARNALKFLDLSGVVLSVELTSGAPMIGIQFHPEGILKSGVHDIDTSGNEEIIRKFITVAKVNVFKNLLHKELLIT